MKILCANKYFYRRGGSEAVFFDTAALLESKGHELVFFSMKHPQNRPNRYEKYFVSPVDYEHAGVLAKANHALKLLYSFEARKRLGRLLDETKPEIAHLHNIHHQLSPSILHALKKRGIPVVMTLHDSKMVCASYLMYTGGKVCEACRGGRYGHCFLKKCVKGSRVKSLVNTVEMVLHHRLLDIYGLVDVFIAPSEFLIKKLYEMGFHRKILHLPNFIEAERYTPVFEGEAGRVLYFGRLSEEKGLMTLLDAVRGQPVRLKLLGEGPLRKSIEQKLKEEAIDNVELMGYVTGDALRLELQRAMFVVLPSQCYENNPMSVIEAFACGKPVLGSRIGGIPELVRDGKTGLTFESGQAGDLRAKILKMAKDSGLCAGMGRQARRFVEDEFHQELYYDKLITIYKGLVSGNRKIPDPALS